MGINSIDYIEIKIFLLIIERKVLFTLFKEGCTRRALSITEDENAKSRQLSSVVPIA